MAYKNAVDTDELLQNDSAILAVMCSSSTLPKDIDYTFKLAKIDISEVEFMNLFFNHATRYFHVNSNNCYNSILSLKDKCYVTNTNQTIPMNFSQLMLTLSSEKKKNMQSTLSASEKIHLLKCASKVTSLAYVQGYQQAFTWFEFTDILIESKTIAHSTNPLDIAHAVVVIQFIFREPLIDLAVEINFNFNVALPGYLNPSNNNSPIPCHYSKMEKKITSPYTIDNFNRFVVSKTPKSNTKIKSIMHPFTDQIKNEQTSSVEESDDDEKSQDDDEESEDDEDEESEDDEEKSVNKNKLEEKIETIKYNTNAIFEQIKQIQDNFSDSDNDNYSEIENSSIENDGDELSKWG